MAKENGLERQGQSTVKKDPVTVAVGGPEADAGCSPRAQLRGGEGMDSTGYTRSPPCQSIPASRVPTHNWTVQAVDLGFRCSLGGTLWAGGGARSITVLGSRQVPPLARQHWPSRPSAMAKGRPRAPRAAAGARWPPAAGPSRAAGSGAASAAPARCPSWGTGLGSSHSPGSPGAAWRRRWAPEEGNAHPPLWGGSSYLRERRRPE